MESPPRDKHLHVFLLSSALLSSQIGRTLEDFTGSQLAMYGPMTIAMTMLFLLVRWTPRPSGSTKSPAEGRMIAVSCLIIALAIVSTVGALVESGSSLLSSNPVQKTLGMLLVFPAMVRAGRCLSAGEIRKALLIFAVFEAVLILALNPLIGWNPNALSMRVAVCGFIGFSLFEHRTYRWLSSLIAVFVPFHYLCRTAAIASVFAFVACYLNLHTRKNRVVAVVLGVVVLTASLPFVDDLTSYASRTAVDMLGSRNPVAHFFLYDKREEDIGGDFLDRQDVWQSSLALIGGRPWLGVGLGNETLYMEVRSHNAMLGAAAEGGLSYAVAWVILTGLILHVLMQEPVCFNDTRGRLVVCGLLLGAYLILAGIVETSGLASISTPGSQIFYLLGFWVAFHQSPNVSVQHVGNRRECRRLEL